jgi:sirohydrochlorin cobaltochelatase
MTIALVLAGHASQISPNTAGIVWDYVDTLRSWAVADEITACFWEEQPYFHQVLDTLQSETIVIVPVFTADGYFSRQVIPAEMNLSGNLTGRDNRKIYYTRPLAQHPYLQTIVRQKVESIMQETALSSEDIAVAIIGHGTVRSASTRKTTEAQVQALQAANIVPEVLSAYLDDEPNIPSIYERTKAAQIIAVPFFLAAGSHATQDVPEALGIRYGDFPAQVDDRTVYYSDSIGSDAAISELILQLANETAITFERKTQNSVWANFPSEGASILRDAVLREGKLQFGELLLTEKSVEPLDSTKAILLDTPASLRKHIRENPFRPLASSCDLKRDWLVYVDSVNEIPAIVETIYPGAVQEWAALENNSFVAETLETRIARQQGIFAKIDHEDEATIAHFVSGVCGRCIKAPLWYEQKDTQNTIPCTSACNYLLTKMIEDKHQ